MEQQESQVGYTSLFVREFVRALPWGIVFTIVLIIFLVGAKRNLMATMDFALERSAQQFKALMLDPSLIGGVKKTFKKGINYGIETGKESVSQTVIDPYIKEEVKKAIDYWTQSEQEGAPPKKK